MRVRHGRARVLELHRLERLEEVAAAESHAPSRATRLVSQPAWGPCLALSAQQSTALLSGERARCRATGISRTGWLAWQAKQCAHRRARQGDCTLEVEPRADDLGRRGLDLIHERQLRLVRSCSGASIRHTPTRAQAGRHARTVLVRAHFEYPSTSDDAQRAWAAATGGVYQRPRTH